MNTVHDRSLEKLDHNGINMVDLMMWLVIAALLLATALQSIGFYQKSANVYLMKQEADVVASRVMASISDRGYVDAYTVDAVVAEENAARPNDGITVSWGDSGAVASAAEAPETDTGFQLASAVTAAPDASAYFIKVTHEAVKDSDVVYFLEDAANYSSGVHLIEKNELGSGTGAPEGKAVNNQCFNGQWKVSYFDSYNFATSTPYSVTCENGDAIKQIYVLGGSKYLPSRVDNFSIRWEKDIVIPKTGDYTFTAKGDDYVRVYIDGVQVMHTVWSDSNGKSATVNIPEGNHKLKVEMTDGVSTGNIEFKYAPAP